MPSQAKSSPDELGIRRRQQRYVEVDGQAVATLAYTLTNPGNLDASDTDPFLVNFLDGGLGVPIVDLEWALSDNLVRSLVANRIVIIGFARNIQETGLHTPATGSHQSVSLLQYTAQALDTLLADDAIHELPVAVQLLLYLLIVAAFLYLYQSMSVKTGVWLTLAMILTYIIIAWLLLGFALVLSSFARHRGKNSSFTVPCWTPRQNSVIALSRPASLPPKNPGYTSPTCSTRHWNCTA